MAWSVEIIVKYASRTALLNAGTATGDNKPTNGTLGIVETELGNLYTYNATIGKWVVHQLNRYTTTDMPTETDFIIPVYTRLINITTGAEFIQQP